MGMFLVLLESPQPSDLLEFISKISELRCDFQVDFVVGNSNKLQKLDLGGKFSWALNVFTFGPTAYATLVLFKSGRD